MDILATIKNEPHTYQQLEKLTGDRAYLDITLQNLRGEYFVDAMGRFCAISDSGRVRLCKDCNEKKSLDEFVNAMSGCLDCRRRKSALKRERKKKLAKLLKEPKRTCKQCNISKHPYHFRKWTSGNRSPICYVCKRRERALD